MTGKPDWDETDVEVSVTFTTKYRVMAEYYPGAVTLEEAMAYDVQNAKDDIHWIHCVGDTEEQITEVTWKKV